MKLVTVNRANSAFDTITKKLSDAGGQFLSNGCFGSTFTHPTNPALVVKVAKTYAAGFKRGTIDDDGYYQYLRNIARFPSIFHPRIADLTVMRQEGSEYKAILVVVMERLLPNADVRNQDAIFALTGAGSAWNLEMEAKRIMREGGNEDQRNLARSLVETWKRCRADLHGKNWMVRSTHSGNVPVITDPAA